MIPSAIGAASTGVEGLSMLYAEIFRVPLLNDTAGYQATATHNSIRC